MAVVDCSGVEFVQEAAVGDEVWKALTRKHVDLFMGCRFCTTEIWFGVGM